jgi:hypothetical protein
VTYRRSRPNSVTGAVIYQICSCYIDGVDFSTGSQGNRGLEVDAVPGDGLGNPSETYFNNSIAVIYNITGDVDE